MAPTGKPGEVVLGGWSTPLVNRESLLVYPVVLCVRCEYVTNVDIYGVPRTSCPRCDFDGYTLHVNDLRGALQSRGWEEASFVADPKTD